ncbi:MAG: hypothetical protein R6V46_04315 [Desulfatiglandaceae bacterium]
MHRRGAISAIGTLSVMEWFLLQIDPVLIHPYRWFDNPTLSWWLGTFIVSLWAAAIGEATSAIVKRVNRKFVKERMDETAMYQDRSINALKSGDKKAYRQINKLANEAFGKSFFLMIAMGMASLWPAFFAAAWLQKRFGDIRFPFPLMAEGLNFVPYFIVCYILARIIVGKSRKHLQAIGKALTNRQDPA